MESYPIHVKTTGNEPSAGKRTKERPDGEYGRGGKEKKGVAK